MYLAFFMQFLIAVTRAFFLSFWVSSVLAVSTAGCGGKSMGIGVGEFCCSQVMAFFMAVRSLALYPSLVRSAFGCGCLCTLVKAVMNCSCFPSVACCCALLNATINWL